MFKKAKKTLLPFLIAAICAGTLSGCGTGTSSSTAPDASPSAAAAVSPDGALKGVTLKIGTSGLFGPFSYYDQDGTTLIGYDIDLINALQGVLGFDIDGNQIQAMDYSALTTSVAEGKLDMAAAALCVTDERKAVIDFSNIYQDSGLVVMVNTDNATF